jgi:hypothetical protein
VSRTILNVEVLNVFKSIYVLQSNSILLFVPPFTPFSKVEKVEPNLLSISSHCAFGSTFFKGGKGVKGGQIKLNCKTI